jgi:ABC-2 type transport system permease protein
VIVKLLLTAATLGFMFLAGKRYFPPGAHVPWFSFTIALLISTWSILSIGFVIASIVPTARFAQPIGAIVLYPMIAFSGLFVHISDLPPVLRVVARVLPLTYAVRLLQGIWNGDGWFAHLGDVAGMTALFLLFTAISARIFRWE